MMVDAIVELTEPQAAGDITESHAKMRLVIEKLAAAGVFKSLALLLKINSSASDLRPIYGHTSLNSIAVVA